MLEGEKELYKQGYARILGTDEAGRGPLAGPLYVAAVIFPKGYENPGIDDSKKLTEKKRECLFDEIVRDALAYGIVRIGVKEIDELNIYEASRRGMRILVESLALNHPDFVVTDCMPLPGLTLPYLHPAKADATYLSVAAASILAKVSRDREMERLDLLYPIYGFAKNKGYGTKAHLDALNSKGPIKGVHRESFEPVRSILQKDLLLF